MFSQLNYAQQLFKKKTKQTNKQNKTKQREDTECRFDFVTQVAPLQIVTLQTEYSLVVSVSCLSFFSGGLRQSGRVRERLRERERERERYDCQQEINQ